MHGVPTPVNTLMQAVARKAAVDGLGVGGIPAAELLAAAKL